MELDWKDIWDRVLKNNNLFPHKKISNNKIELSCPTRFSLIGAFNIEVTAKFNDDYIELSLLTFNDNITLDDLENTEVDDTRKQFNALSNSLNEFESKNKIQDRFEIKSEGFESDAEAESALLDYLNSKATESGRSFDDKLDFIESSNSLPQAVQKFAPSGNFSPHRGQNINLSPIIIFNKIIQHKSLLKDIFHIF